MVLTKLITTLNVETRVSVIVARESASASKDLRGKDADVVSVLRTAMASALASIWKRFQEIGKIDDLDQDISSKICPVIRPQRLHATRTMRRILLIATPTAWSRPILLPDLQTQIQ